MTVPAFALVALFVLAFPAAAQDLRPWCGAGPLNAAERTICGTDELARLDRRLAEIYGSLRSADTRQDAWLRSDRDACGADVACLRAAYVDRIRLLRIRQSLGPPDDDG